MKCRDIATPGVAMDNAEVTAILASIASLLEACHEQSYVLIVRNAISGPNHGFGEFLNSNDLWAVLAQSLINHRWTIGTA